jgi:DNA-binding NarL/FixJ family response regulator
MTASVLIADDHDLARAGLVAMISRELDFHIVSEAADGAAAVAACRLHAPDLAVLDIRMPELDGLSAAREIRVVSPKTKVLIVTMHDSLEYLEAAIQAGASGYVLKDASRSEIVATMRRVLDGEAFFNADLVARLLRRVASRTASEKTELDQLTPREREVLVKIAEGQTNKEIARSLALAPGTVKIHVERIIAKLGVADRTQAAVLAVRSGLLPNEVSLQ